jgi:hypothetical protein
LPWLPWNTNNPNSLLSKAHLTTLNLNNFEITEAMGLKIIALGSPCMASVSKLLGRDTQTDRQTGDLISLLSFLESRLKMEKSIKRSPVI